MALTQNTFDGGALGATITEANSGGASGTPFHYVEIDAGASAVYSGLAGAHGGRGARIAGNGAHAFLQHEFVGNKKLKAKFFVRFPSAPTSNCQIYTPRNAVNYVGGINITTALKFQITHVVGTGMVLWSSVALSTNFWYRVEISHSVGTATTGDITFKYFDGDSTTPLETFTTSSANLGTENLIMYRVGKINNAGSTPMDLDSITFSPGDISVSGPHVDLSIPPTANPGNSSVDVEPGTVVTLSGSGTDPDGTIVSHSWAQTSGEPVTLSGSGATRTFTAPPNLAGTVLGFTLTVTDNTGMTSSRTVSHAVLRSTERVAVGGKWVPARMETVS